MTGSALYGQPPSNPRDYAIVRGLLRAYGFPPSMDPGRGIPTRQHAPPNYHFETRGPGVIGGLCVAILLAFLITGTRLLLRLLRKDLRWGLDDWVIIPAGVGHPPFTTSVPGANGRVGWYDGLDGLPNRHGHTRGDREAHMGCHL